MAKGRIADFSEVTPHGCKWIHPIMTVI